MRFFTISMRKKVTVLVLAAFCLRSVVPASAESPVKLQNWAGSIDFSTERLSTFALAGTASHLGKFTAYGEVNFVPGAAQGSLDGDGVVVFKAANGDLLVGVVIWTADPEAGGLRTSHSHSSWRDPGRFSNGTVVGTTGHSGKARPPAPGAMATSAIWMGLLV